MIYLYEVLCIGALLTKCLNGIGDLLRALTCQRRQKRAEKNEEFFKLLVHTIKATLDTESASSYAEKVLGISEPTK
jgi:hypothetical protein